MSDDDHKGRGNPPKAHQFKKGQSGNPRGRPKGKHKEPPYEAILGQLVTVTEDGQECQITAEEAFLKALFNQANKGSPDAAMALLGEMEEQEHRQERKALQDDIPCISLNLVAQGSVSHHLRDLKIIKTIYAKQANAAEKILNWMVEFALKRLGEYELSLEEQKIVFNATYRPEKMNWPSWWRYGTES